MLAPTFIVQVYSLQYSLEQYTWSKYSVFAPILDNNAVTLESAPIGQNTSTEARLAPVGTAQVYRVCREYKCTAPSLQF